MTHFTRSRNSVAICLAMFLSACVAASGQNSKNLVLSINAEEIDDNFTTREFARLCLARDYSVAQSVELAKTDGWEDAADGDLKNSGLENLRRKILEIPGGGGRYRETQTILKYALAENNLFANLMERFDRHETLVSTECTFYLDQQNYLPVCTALGKLLKRPPDSNNKFPNSNSQFIRWNVIISEKTASLRCDGMGKKKTGTRSVKKKPFTGTIISMVVDQTI